MGRWGEKVPATVGTVAKRFALLQLCALYVERSLLTAKGTRPSAVRAGLLRAQGMGLLFEKGLQSSFGEPGSSSEGDLLHGSEIDIESRPLVAIGASGDNFAPLGSEVAEFLEFFGSE